MVVVMATNAPPAVRPSLEKYANDCARVERKRSVSAVGRTSRSGPGPRPSRGQEAPVWSALDTIRP